MGARVWWRWVTHVAFRLEMLALLRRQTVGNVRLRVQLDPRRRLELELRAVAAAALLRLLLGIRKPRECVPPDLIAQRQMDALRIAGECRMAAVAVQAA